MKNNNAIVFIANKKYLFALAAILINLKVFNKKLYDEVVIYHYELSESDEVFLRRIEGRIKFVSYSYENWVEEHGDVESKEAQIFVERFTHLAWAKYKIIEQLEFYKKILYLDLDILIRGDISGIFDIDGAAWRNGFNFRKKFELFYKRDISSASEVADLDQNSSAPNGGLLYFSDSIDYGKCLIDGRNFIKKYLNYFSTNLDELTVAWMLHSNGVNVRELNPFEYNVLPEQCLPSSKIIHFLGGISYGGALFYKVYFRSGFNFIIFILTWEARQVVM